MRTDTTCQLIFFSPAQPLQRCNCSGSREFSWLGLAIQGCYELHHQCNLAYASTWGIKAGASLRGRYDSNQALLWPLYPRHPHTWSYPVRNHTALWWEYLNHLRRDSLETKKETTVVKPDNVSLISLIPGLFSSHSFPTHTLLTCPSCHAKRIAATFPNSKLLFKPSWILCCRNSRGMLPTEIYILIFKFSWTP